MEASGCFGYCVERYITESAVLADKRLSQQCGSTHEMFKKIKKGKGQHLVKIVSPHMEKCVECQKWAHSRGYNWRKILQEALT